MGWENRFHCEWNEFGKKVLKYYWPEADSHDDITKTDFTKYNGTIDLISGGFPCQPYSSAGKRLGKADDRHLWPHMLRAIKEVTPRWVVGENVRGLTNWNGGLVFDEVCADLENLGYQVAPYLIPACAVNAPHRRERIWFVAHTDQRSEGSSRTSGSIESNRGNGHIFTEQWRESSELNNRLFEFSRNASDTTGKQSERMRFEQREYSQQKQGEFRGNNNEMGNGNASDTDCANHQTRTQRKVLGQSDREKTNGYSNVECSNKWENFPTVSPICIGDDGISNRLDSITFPKWRNESIKAGGNAVVPQVVYQIFKAIEQYETTQRNTSNRNS
ncbi:MAG: DNA (cytosine-5-)-methyltransferase [Cytophagia bacterium]|nr:DNA (cytosine-5-)-methyltransferase [Cytophagia bacterium]